MNRITTRALLTVACMAVTFSAYAQSSGAMSADTAPSTAQAAKSASKSDRELSRAVRRALGKAAGFDVSGVFVRARDGAVTLSGTVKDGDQVRQAEEVSRTVAGVKSVSNKLTLFHGGNG